MQVAGAIITPVASSDFLDYVSKQSGQRILDCYQCGKCSAGCPTAYDMDLTPRQMIRAIQLGLKEEALKSSTIWMCVSCQTCSVRCPVQIDIAKAIEAVRLLAVAEKFPAADKNVRLYHQVFLKSVEFTGRLYEMGLSVAFNMLSFHPLTGIDILPTMLRKGKLALLPVFKGTGEVEAIFAKLKR